MTATTVPPTTPSPRYLAPDWFSRHIMNPAIRRLVRMGVGAWGARELRVVGRRSGEVRTNVVNILELDGERYLVAPRGVTQWVRNVRAAGGGELRIGRRTEAFTVVEVPDDEHKVEVLRAYLARWRWEVGQFFDGVDAEAPEADLARIAPGYPVFALAPAA